MEPEDTPEVLQAYAERLGLGFPVGREEGTDLERFVTEGIPTSLLVDATGRVAALEVGARLSTEQFLDWYDGYIGESYDPAVCTYTVWSYDADLYEERGGVTVNFCSDTACHPVTTDETGCGVFTGAPGRYHVEVVRWPEGFEPEGDREWDTEVYSQTFYVALTASDK